MAIAGYEHAGNLHPETFSGPGGIGCRVPVVYECQTCRALVLNPEAHTHWHDLQDELADPEGY